MNWLGPIHQLGSIPTFRQRPGETLKDAWERINRMRDEEPIPCNENHLNLYFYHGLDNWYKTVLDKATGGNYVLSSPAGSTLALINIFGTYQNNDKDTESFMSVLESAKLRIETCITQLPEKDDFEQLENLVKSTLPDIEDKMALILQKLKICEGFNS